MKLFHAAVACLSALVLPHSFSPSSSSLSFVSANSAGIGVKCYVDNPFLGTTNRQKPNDPTDIVMWWTLKPTWAGNKYTTTAIRDGATTTSYVPGEWTDIVVRTTTEDQQYTGLLLYAIKQGAGGAEDASKVGQWFVPPRVPFGLDDAGTCVSHRNADPKAYKTTFRVKFPAGTGTVQIKALVKYGLAFPAMSGAFYWPNTAHITLTEGTVPVVATKWLQAAPGQSCNSICQQNGMGCDLNTLRSTASNPTNFYAAVKKSTTCSLPMLRGCSADAPAVGTEGCFYHDDTCNRSPTASTWVQTDPCATLPVFPAGGPFAPDQANQCCAYQGFKWCAKYYINSAPTQQQYGPWAKGAACAPAGGYPQPTFPPVYQPVAAAATSCESTDADLADGGRICACATGAPTSSQTDPPTPASTTPKPTATAGSTQTPTTSKPGASTAAPPAQTTQAPTTTANSVAGGSGWPVSIMATTAGATFTVPVAYRSDKGNRVINVDILSQGDFGWFGKGIANVGAASSTQTVQVTITVQTTLPTTKQYQLNIFMVDASVYNTDPENAYKSAVASVSIEVGINGATIPPTRPPTKPLPNLNAASSVAPQSATVALLSTFATLVAMLGSSSASSSSRIYSSGSRASMLACMLGVFVMLLSFISPSHAHNWLTSPARANKGGGANGNYNGFTSPPCPPKGGRVHVQAGPGQRFPIEWASGHGYGSYTYFIVLKAIDEYQMARHTRELIEDYLNNAPTNTYMLDAPAMHVTNNGASNAGSLVQPDVTAQYPRPAPFRPMPNAKVYNKNAAARALDKRASYSSTKYPWIVSAHKFALNEDKPDEMDLAMMEIPAGQPSGQYVIQYFWNGYYDCVDVNLLAVQSTDVWGSSSTSVEGGLDLYHHCLYTPGLNNYKAFDNECYALAEGETVDQCAAACLSNNDQYNACDAIQVTPAKLPDGLSFVGRHQTGTKHYPASCNSVITRLQTKNADLGNTMLCYNMHSGDAPEVGPPYKIVTDPDDPVFYSTCYMKKGAWTFAQPCPACTPSPPPADYRFGERCISCADMNRNFYTAAPPKWIPIDTCQACDASLG